MRKPSGERTNAEPPPTARRPPRTRRNTRRFATDGARSRATVVTTRRVGVQRLAVGGAVVRDREVAGGPVDEKVVAHATECSGRAGSLEGLPSAARRRPPARAASSRRSPPRAARAPPRRPRPAPRTRTRRRSRSARRRPRASSATGGASRQREDVHRPRTAATTARMSSSDRRPGRVEHVGAGLLVGAQPRDRVVEVVAAVEVVLGARGEHERPRPRARPRAAAATRAAATSSVEDRRRRRSPRSSSPPGRRRARGAPSPRRRPARDAKQSSRSADTGRSVAATIAAACSIASARVTDPSCRPSVVAKPLLVVASASKPSDASSRAEPASHGLGMSSGVPGTCSAANARARSAALTGPPPPGAAPRRAPATRGMSSSHAAASARSRSAPAAPPSPGAPGSDTCPWTSSHESSACAQSSRQRASHASAPICAYARSAAAKRASRPLHVAEHRVEHREVVRHRAEPRAAGVDELPVVDLEQRAQLRRERGVAKVHAGSGSSTTRMGSVEKSCGSVGEILPEQVEVTAARPRCAQAR